MSVVRVHPPLLRHAPNTEKKPWQKQESESQSPSPAPSASGGITSPKNPSGTLRTGSLILNLAGPITQRLDWRAGAGVIHYWPADEQGIFLRGGPTRFLVGAGVDYRSSLLTSLDLMVSLRYDWHRFTTDELEARNFSGSQGVQRLSASVGFSRARP